MEATAWPEKTFSNCCHVHCSFNNWSMALESKGSLCLGAESVYLTSLLIPILRSHRSKRSPTPRHPTPTDHKTQHVILSLRCWYNILPAYSEPSKDKPMIFVTIFYYPCQFISVIFKLKKCNFYFLAVRFFFQQNLTLF